MTTFATTPAPVTTHASASATTPAPTPATTRSAPAGNGRRAMLFGLLLDVGLPAGGYYALHELFGMNDTLALTVGGALAGVRILYTVVRDRRVDGFAAFVLGMFVVGLGLTFLTGDVRFVLAKDSLTTGLAGLVFLVTCAVGRPITHYSSLRFDPAHREHLKTLFATSTRYRAFQRTLSLLWAGGLLAEAALRVVLVYQLPVATVVGLSTVLQLGFMGLLGLATVLLVRRAMRRA